MKISLASFCLLFTVFAHSQITVDPTWFPRPGVEYVSYMSFGELAEDRQTPEFGLDQEWDFSRLPTSLAVDSVSFVRLEESSFPDSFPQADVVEIVKNDFITFEWYYRTTQDTVYEEGFALLDDFFNDDTLYQIHSPNEIIETYAGMSLGDTLAQAENNFRFWHFYGTGTVTTPEGVFEDCILMRDDAPGTGPAGTFSFHWYHRSFMREVASFIPDESDHPSAVISYSAAYTDPLSDVNVLEDRDLSLSIYARSKQLQILNSGAAAIDSDIYLYDLSGRLLSKATQQILPGENTVGVNCLENTEPQAHVVLIVDKQTGTFFSRKIIF